MTKIEPLGVMQLTTNLIDWLKNGNRDEPTETVVSALTGILIIKEVSYPETFHEFENLFSLFQAEPLIYKNFNRMKFIDKNWKNVVDNFDFIEAEFNKCNISESYNSGLEYQIYLKSCDDFKSTIITILNK